MTRRRRTTAPALELRGLELLTATENGDLVLPGLTLIASPDLVTVSGPSDQLLRSWTWSEITGLDADRWAWGSGGHPLQVLELTAGGRSHRFLVGAPDLSAFLDAAAGWSLNTAPPGTAESAPPSRLRRSRRAPRSARASLAQASLTLGRGFGWLGRGRPRHGRTWRVRPAGACIGAVALIGGGATWGAIGTGGAQAADPRGTTGGGVSIMSRMAKEFASRATAADLPAATTPPAPAPPSLAGSAALQSHEIFGFAPYWTLPQESGFTVSDLTTIAYFSVDVNGDGTVQNSGPGWTGYQSQALSDLITRAHTAGSRVVLTASCFGQSALDQVTSDPNAATRLATTLVQLVSAKNLDGVNLDFEGEGAADQAGLTALVSRVSGALRAANPHWQVTMDTYASSAGDPGGFYDIAGLAPSVDAFFVMAYDMNAKTPSPTAPLTGSGFTDLQALQEYTSVVPASKVILGVPYYGYDWPTSGPGLGSPATGGPTPLSYSQITSGGHPVYWDSATQTAWTSYQVGNQWHQTWFDDPTSLALKAQLANFFHVAGLGVWALGMDGNDPSMLAALLGSAPVVKDFQPGPGATTPTTSSTTTTTTTAAAGYSYSGVWNGATVSLAPVDLSTLPDHGASKPVGPLTGFTTNDPAAGCLASGEPLSVSELLAEPNVFVVVSQAPADCVSEAWTFVPDSGLGASGPGGGASGGGASGGGGSGGGGSGSGSSGTTTTTSSTTSPSTTTTTSTVPPG
ncbi:MAG TPA: glycosyl hydrolase family 18 protein [Acidimicrobiales bacterium]|nr:glycosyl hydrolase family 18 protein [Acidimicrobiales bacterium]